MLTKTSADDGSDEKALAVGIESQKYTPLFPDYSEKRTILYVSLKFGIYKMKTEGEINLQKKIAGKLATGLEMPGLSHSVLGEKMENLLLVYVGLNEMNGEKNQ
ncbi:MAG: hypothetical protein ACLUTU_14390 [Blautia faecis]